ncbi:MAG: hypothetical protein FWF44_12210, partial [Defluviitaleaceae bacterium]|nr:hypothetical protein [Defluviitaleaceae bacterium]
MSIRRLLKMPYHARHGFKTRLTLIICLFTLIPLTLLGLIYGRFLYQRQEQSIISQQDTLLKTASGNLSALLGAKEQNVALLDQNTTLKKLMSINLRNNTAEFYLY